MVYGVLALLEPATVGDSTPVVLTIGAIVTLVSVAFGAGLVYSRIGARMTTIDGPRGELEQVRGRLDTIAASLKSETASLRRAIEIAERDCGEGDAAISARVHRLGDIAQDLLVRMAQAETHLGYDGRGQTTPVRNEPAIRPRPRDPRRDPDPGESR